MNDGTWKAFEDASAAVAHKCAEYVNLKSKIPSNDDHKLLSTTVTRVSEAEITIDKHEQRLNEKDNEVRIIRTELDEIKLRLGKLEH